MIQLIIATTQQSEQYDYRSNLSGLFRFETLAAVAGASSGAQEAIEILVLVEQNA